MNAVLQLAPAPPSAALRIGVEEHLLSLALTGIPELTQGIPANLRVEDFASGWTRAVFEKVLSLREAGEPITCDFVADALRSDNRLAAVVFGGSSGLEALRLLAGRANFLDGSVAKVARKVRELADSRRESDARERAGLRLANGDPIPDVFRALESEIGDRSRRANEGLTPSDLIAAMRAEGQ